MENRRKTGIYGGSFNPPHLGHRRLCSCAADALGLDRVLIIPANVPPHKQPVDFAGAADRLNMCRLAFEDDDRFEVSTLEIDRGSRSYTVETLEELHNLYPDDDFYLIIGSDMLEGFRKWYRWEDILNLCFVCPAVREKKASLDLSSFTEDQQKKFIRVDIDPIEASSTQIRAVLAKGGCSNGVLDSGVAEYIRINDLYADRFPEYRKVIEAKLDPERLNHSFGVSRAARKLAIHYGADAGKAELAGLLHDVMKNASADEQREIIERGGHKLTAVEEANHKVWHAMAGEAYARLELGITDEDILSAIRYHTTGHAGMTLLEKIIYTADFISEERSYPDVGTVRTLAFDSLDKAIIYTSAYTIRTLAQQNYPVHTDTVDCYNDILINFRKED